MPGVSFHKARKVWTAVLQANGRPLNLGDYRTQEEAAGAIKAALSLARRGLLAVTVESRIDPVLRARREVELGRVPKGVVFHAFSGLWNARIGWQGKKVSLGYFKDQEKAEAAYWEARARMARGRAPRPSDGRPQNGSLAV